MKKVLLSIIVILFGISCQKDISADMTTPNIGIPKLPVTPVTGSVAGIVVNETNQPVANVAVSIGTSIYMTDNKGMFRTNNLTLDKYITTVKAEKAGYFTGYRSFSANATKNYVTIKLIPKTLAGTFASGSTGSITLTNGSSINFQSNSIIVKSTGAAYTGTVNVYAAYIDPTASDIGATVPGSMMAEDASNFYVLRSTGMMAVELESAAGVPLQLATAKPATMKLTIPTSLLSQAPATIDTWSLDNRGIWIKEGTGTKNGNAYDFEVSHFSFWNCDQPINAVYLTLNLKDQNNNILSNIYVTLTSSTIYGIRGGMTDSLGNVSGMIPKDETLTASAYSNIFNCGTPLYAQQIGPFATNTTLNLVATINAAQQYTISGSALNCLGTALAAGTVYLHSGYYQTSAPVTNGNFSITVPFCSTPSSFDIIVVDNSGGQQSTTTTVTVTGNTVAAGIITACGTSTNQYINYSVDGTAFTINSLNPANSLIAFVTALSTSVMGYSQTSTNMLTFGVAGTSTGTFPVSADSLTVNNIPNPVAQTGATVTITAFGLVGQYIEGFFDIPFTATGSVHTLTGSFRVRRN